MPAIGHPLCITFFTLVSALHDVCINSLRWLSWYGIKKSIGYGLLHTSHCRIQEAILLSMRPPRGNFGLSMDCQLSAGPVDMSNDKPGFVVSYVHNILISHWDVNRLIKVFVWCCFEEPEMFFCDFGGHNTSYPTDLLANKLPEPTCITADWK